MLTDIRALADQFLIAFPNISSDLTYEEYLIKILETAERVTRSRVIKMCKVQWNRYSEAEATWEREDNLRKSYSYLFE